MTVRLLAGDEEFALQSLRLERSLRAASGQFEAQVHDPRARKILRPGARISILEGESLLLKGYVDDYGEDSTHDSSTATLAGRDSTEDLVDSTPILPAEWHSVHLLKIVRDVCRPYEIAVQKPFQRRGVEDAFFENFTLLEGETAWNIIERACRMKALLAFADPHGKPNGGLRIEPPGFNAAGVRLEDGVNLERFAIHRSHARRFSTYVVRGQRPGSEQDYGLAVVAVEGTAEDHEIGRHRPLVVVAETAVDSESATLRAQWEASVRAARSATVQCTVQGIQRVNNAGPWLLNEVAPVLIPSMEVDSEMLIEGVRFEHSEAAGTTTTLQLVRQDAYLPNPTVSEQPNPFDDLAPTTTQQGDIE